MKTFAVILAGCGRLDGSEIHESVLSLLSLKQAQANYQCFSIDASQEHVSNHLTNQTVAETRNMLVESARIARGEVKPLTQLDVTQYDGLVIPGGNGIAANLFTYAKDGANFNVNPLLAKICLEFTKQNKPVGFICIAPLMIPAIYPFAVKLTLGSDPQTSKLATKRGAIHQICAVDEICVDTKYKIVSTPAYMLAKDILETYIGINKLVKQLVLLAN